MPRVTLHESTCDSTRFFSDKTPNLRSLVTQLGYLDDQNCDKSEILVCVNGLRILNIKKIIFANAKIIFLMQSVRYGYITRNSPISGVSEIDNHMDFADFLKIQGFNFDFLGQNPLLSGSRQNSLTHRPQSRLWGMVTL